jgi:hypothetical protein
MMGSWAGKILWNKGAIYRFIRNLTVRPELVEGFINLALPRHARQIAWNGEG